MNGVDTELVERLRERGLRVTSQRLVIHRALRARSQHVSAEQVHEQIAESLPGTSLPTVYATLELLEELGLTRRVDRGAAPLLFDSRTTPHGHALCRSCGAIVDLEGATAPPAALREARALGFSPDHAQVLVSGRCAACAASA
ncbi:MAG TPA: Fur family transcriptional regulator [Solirubrobacteraceae bacterium]|nr:Fur family transcriptional regulator [Solirubrobacteraceae bacterium]